jgi:4-amino-4-deoxy-L-arabinose transferase-like glycosyltransferase
MDIQVRREAAVEDDTPAGGGRAAFFDASAPLGPRIFRILCVLVCLAALLVRLPTLASRSLWIDETYSAWFASVPLAELWTRVPLYETHPPFYYTLLKGWQAVAGHSEAALRALSVLASVATVFLFAAAPRAARLGPLAQRVGLLGALFLALNAGSVQFAQQARPYALQALSAAVAIWCSFMLLTEAGSRGRARWRWTAGLGLGAGLTLWLHNTGPFVLLAIWSGMLPALWLLPGERRRAVVLSFACAGVLAVLLWLPFVPTFLAQGAGMAKLDFWVRRFHPSDLFSAWVLAAGGRPLKIPVALLGALGLAFLWRRYKPMALHLLAVLVVAPGAMAAYSYLVKSIFLPRLFEWLAAPMMALLALGVFALRPAWRKPAAALVVAVSAYALLALYGRSTENWREMLARLAAGARSGDLILAIPNEVQMPARYYLEPKAVPVPVVYLPAPFPALGLPRRYIGNLGAPAVNGADVQRVRSLLPQYRRVWLIERRSDLYDPHGAVYAAIAGRGRVVEVIDGSGATITLFELGQGPARAARAAH